MVAWRDAIWVISGRMTATSNGCHMRTDQIVSMHTLRTMTIVSAILLTGASSWSSAAEPVSRQDIVAKRIGGFPVLHCRIRYKEDEIEVHLLFDTSLDVPLEIHKRTVPGLGLHPETATGQKVDVEFMGGVHWKGLTIRAEHIPMLEALTKQYSKELGEVPVVGLIGPLAVRSNVIELDLRKQLLRTMGMASDEARAAEMPYETKQHGLVFKGVGPTGKPVDVVLVTKTEDLVLDTSLLESARKAGKKPNVLGVGDVAFGDIAAIRFKDLREQYPAPVNAVIGSEALKNCTVTIWPKRKKIAFVAQPASSFPSDEQEYFFAIADRNAEVVAKFIATKPRQRLLDEACLELFDIRANDPRTSLDVLKDTLKVIAQNYHVERRSEALMRVADAIESSRHPNSDELMLFALQLAVQQSGNAVQPTAVHDVHVRLGRRSLAKGDIIQARRHLLSAAFGMPKDGKCNYWLGELYRKSNKLRRAWSRYFQAILCKKLEKDDPIRLKALERLDQLNADPNLRSIFDMITAEQYMAGRFADAEFHAKTRYRFMKEQYPGHAKLGEFFIDSTYGGTGGMELAFQALDEFFGGKVPLITYHLNDPMQCQAAKDRLAYYKRTSAPLGVFDGKPVVSSGIERGGTLALIAAANYPAFIKASLRDTANPKQTWELDGVMERDKKLLALNMDVKGVDKPDGLKLHVILCERSVMAINGNSVYFHHCVARDILTPRDGLDVKDALKETIAFTIDPEALQKKLRKEQPPSIGGGTQSAPYVDANMLVAVAIIQRSADGHVLAAKAFSLPEKEDKL